MLKFYGDESINDETSLMNLSGLLMTNSQFESLDLRVKEARGELSYFHMKEGHHRKYSDVYSRLYSLFAPEAIICGFSVSIFLNEFERLSRKRSEKTADQSLGYWFGGSYTYLVGLMMYTVGRWLEGSPYKKECVEYFFENNPHQGDADTFWRMLNFPQYKERRKLCHYYSHTFLDGKGPFGSVLQLCDIFAWNMTDLQRRHKQTEALDQIFSMPIGRVHHTENEIARTFSSALDYWGEFDKKGRPLC